MTIHVTLARLAIESYLHKNRELSIAVAKTTLDIPADLFNQKAGVFVTLHLADHLRGCIGTIEPQTDSVVEEIIRNAVLSATKDPRFAPLEIIELDDISISVDVLGDSEKTTLADLDPTRYGVIVEHEWQRGLLLPNLDGIDTKEEQVAIALQKAGIRPSDPYDLYRFEVVRYE